MTENSQVMGAGVRPTGTSDDVLVVDGLRVALPSRFGSLYPVDGVGFRMPAGSSFGIVGESGSGKSMTALAVAGLLGGGAHATDGSVRFEGEELLGASRARLEQLRGRRIGFVFQDPMSSLNPTLTVGFQLSEPLRRHLGLGWRASLRRAAELLDEVGIADAARRLGDYPHQFSGGMRQRVVIAMAVACRPSLVIADEPTTALDVTVQAQILDLLQVAAREHGTALLLITHNLAVASQVCDRVAVMYAGRIVEEGPAADLLDRPRVPYTQGLLDCLPDLDRPDMALRPIPGNPPSLAGRPSACRFHDRCPIAVDVCRAVEPELRPVGADFLARCHLVEASPS